MQCVVPNCENTIGVPFPEDSELHKEWIKSLQITEGSFDVNSLVCFDHFDNNDFEEIINQDGSAEKRLRPGATPRLFALQDAIQKETREFLEFRTQKNVTSQGIPEDTPLDETITEPVTTEQSDETKTDNEIQEFTEGTYILEQQEYSEPQSSQPLFTTYVEGNPEDNPDEEQNMVVQENEDFMSVQHEFSQQEVFVTENNKVYTSDGQELLISEGDHSQEAFVTQQLAEDEDHTHENVQDSCQNERNVVSDESMDAAANGIATIQQILSADCKDDSTRMTDSSNANEDQAAPAMDQSYPAEFHEEFEDTSIEQQYEDQSANQAETQETHEEVPQQSDESVLVDNMQLKQETAPENLVMQWFVSNKSGIKLEPGAHRSKIAIPAEEEQIMISYQDETSNPNVMQQEVALRNNQNVTETKLPKRSRMSDDKSKEDSCRLCMSNEQVNVNIVDNIKDDIMVLEAIQLCIYSLEISLEDPFSKKICVRCFNLLQKYFEFRQNCINVDNEQRKTYEKEQPVHKFIERQQPPQRVGNYTRAPRRTHMRTIISPSSVGYQETEIVTVIDPNVKNSSVKNVSRKVILTPTVRKKPQSEEIHHLLKDVNSAVGPNERCVRQIISKVSRADDIQVFKLNKSSSNHNGQSYSTGHKVPAIPITLSPKKLKPSQLEALARKPPLSTEKQLKLQEELKKVIEGKMSKDDLSVDHIIVRVVSDDETDVDEHFPIKRKKYNVPIVSAMEGRHDYRKMKIGRGEVMLPRGIRVSIPEKFESSKGVFPCFPKVGALGSEFAIVDGYLFEYRLCKGNERILKCLTCPATAIQKLLPNGHFENRATVRTCHNHYQLTNAEIKKQMFYYVMKKKMQTDKGLNFRAIYENICEKDPEMRALVPLRNLINEICKHQLTQKTPHIKSFDEFYNIIEDDSLQKFQFTYAGKQFYQERFTVKEDGTKAVIFANLDTIKKVSHSKLMYVDASFRIDTPESFAYQLVTVLVWVDDSYYPIMFALVSNRTMEIFKMIFSYLHDTLAPNLCPQEIVTDYEANLYYALGETYLESHIGGSVFYYTQNIYKKICELGLSRELETIPYFRNVYHMLLMLPLLPVNTIIDGLNNIEIQANDLGVGETTAGLFRHIREQWMEKVSPDLFCVHRLENRINENVIAPFKKLRDFLMLFKGKTQRQALSIMIVVEKLIDLENFLHTTYSSENRKSFGRDLSSSQKKNVLKAWQYIETHPKININHFFTKVIGYIKCMENQLWIWGYYKFTGSVTDDLINAANFSIVNTSEGVLEMAEQEDVIGEEEEGNYAYAENVQDTVVVEALVGPSGEFVISDTENSQKIDNPIFNYVYKE